MYCETEQRGVLRAREQSGGLFSVEPGQTESKICQPPLRATPRHTVITNTHAPRSRATPSSMSSALTSMRDHKASCGLRMHRRTPTSDLSAAQMHTPPPLWTPMQC